MRAILLTMAARRERFGRISQPTIVEKIKTSGSMQNMTANATPMSIDRQVGFFSSQPPLRPVFLFTSWENHKNEQLTVG